MRSRPCDGTSLHLQCLGHEGETLTKAAPIKSPLEIVARRPYHALISVPIEIMSAQIHSANAWGGAFGGSRVPQDGHTISGTPPTLVAATGRPYAAASLNTIP